MDESNRHWCPVRRPESSARLWYDTSGKDHLTPVTFWQMTQCFPHTRIRNEKTAFAFIRIQSVYAPGVSLLSRMGPEYLHCCRCGFDFITYVQSKRSVIVSPPKVDEHPFCARRVRSRKRSITAADKSFCHWTRTPFLILQTAYVRAYLSL